MIEKKGYREEERKLKQMVRSVSDSPGLEDLPLLFCREETRHAARYAAGITPSPAELAHYFWEKDMNAFTQKSLVAHMRGMGGRPKAVLSLLLALSVVLGTVVGSKTENGYAGIATTTALAGGTFAAFRKLLKISLESAHVSQHTQKFYHDLKKVYNLCTELPTIPADGTYENYARVLSLVQEAQALILKMQRELEEATQRNSGTFLKRPR